MTELANMIGTPEAATTPPPPDTAYLTFMIFHDLILLSGGAERLTTDQVARFWSKAPEDRIQKWPAGGSRGYQREWYRAIMESMLGGDFEKQVAEAVEQMRPHLRKNGALL